MEYVKTVLFCLFLFPCIAVAQQVDLIKEWSVTYGSTSAASEDVTNDVALDGLGNTYVTGYSTIATTKADYLTIKYDAEGREVWAARFDGASNDDEAVAVAVDPADQVYVTGYSMSASGERSVVTIKYDVAGSQLWTVQFGSLVDEVKAMIMDEVGNLYISASMGEENLTDLVILKYDPEGTLLWNVWLEKVGGEAHALALDSEGNLYTGGTNLATEAKGFVVAKCNANGDLLWRTAYGGMDATESDAEVYDMVIDDSDDVYLTGRIRTSSGTRALTVKFDAQGTLLWRHLNEGTIRNVVLAADENGIYAGGIDSSFLPFVITKYSLDGELLWQNRSQGVTSGWCYVEALGVDGDEVVATGYCNDSEDFRNPASGNFTVRYDADGTPVWERFEVNEAMSLSTRRNIAMVLSENGEGYLAAPGTSSGTGLDFSTQKFDRDGMQLWRAEYHTPENRSADRIQVLDADAQGNVYVGLGAFSQGISSGLDDFLIIKYAADGTRQWATRYDHNNRNDLLTDLAVDATGHVYATGISYNSAGPDMVTIKLNPDGILEWVAESTPFGSATAIALDAGGAPHITGGIGSIFLTLKYDETGEQQWIAGFDAMRSPSTGVPVGIAFDGVGNTYIVGHIGSRRGDFGLIKYDVEGNQVWAAQYDRGDTVDVPAAFAVDEQGNTYIVGGNPTSTTEAQAIVAYDTEGQLRWEVERNDRFGAVVLSPQGDVIVSGVRGGSVGDDSEGVLLRYDAEGNEQWTTVFASEWVGTTHLAFDAQGNIIVVDDFGNDFWVYDPSGQFLATVDVNQEHVPRATDTFIQAYQTDASGDLFLGGYQSGLGWEEGIVFKYSMDNSVAIEEPAPALPALSLLQNHPNPFSASTVITYHLSKRLPVRLTIYDVLGREVEVLIEKVQEAGRYSVDFDGSRYSNGLYFYQIEAEETRKTGRMLLIH